MAYAQSDSQLDAAQRGDRSALDALLAQHRKAVFRYGLRHCGSTEDAEDAVQETLWAAAKAIRQFRRAAHVTTWLFTIVRNNCHRLRSHQHHPADLADLLAPVPTPGRSPEEEVAFRQTQQVLAAALERLALDQREVILLRDVEGLTAPQAAHRLGVTVQALKSRLHRARAQLRQEVGAVLGSISPS